MPLILVSISLTSSISSILLQSFLVLPLSKVTSKLPKIGVKLLKSIYFHTKSKIKSCQLMHFRLEIIFFFKRTKF